MLFLPGRLKGCLSALTVAVSVLLFAVSVAIYVAGPADYVIPLVEYDGATLSILLTVSPLGALLLMPAMGFGSLISLYSLRSMAGAKHTALFYGSILLTLAGAAGILLSDNLFGLVIFWEIVTVSLYLLISTGGEKTKFAATKTFAMIGLSDAALLLGVFMFWGISGTLSISATPVAADSAIPIAAFLLLMTAAITKAGAMPFHTWVPTAGENASASVMALLPAAIDKLLGIYLLVVIVRRIFIVATPALSITLSIIGSATIIIAVMVAMVQHDLKKLLSFHAVSQVGYMILGIATGTPVGIIGGVFHMINNSIYKCCLFLCAGAVEKQAGTGQLDQLGGLGNKMAFTFSTCLIAALSISGIPPLNGFVSKWMVYQGVIEAGNSASGAGQWWPVWLFCAMFGSALTLASFVKVMHSVFLSRCPSKLDKVTEAPPVMWIPMVVLAALCVLLGVFYKFVLKYFLYPALEIEGLPGISGTWDSGLATALIIVGILIGLGILFFGYARSKVRIVPTWTCGEIQDNDSMIIPGTHFYKTITSMGGLKQLYAWQKKGFFDPYDQAARVGGAFIYLLRKLHNGVLPRYLTWMTFGLLLIILIICQLR